MRSLILDDEALARREMRYLLTRHPAIRAIDEAATVDEAVERIAAHPPDLIFLDIELQGESGFDLVARLARLCEPLPHLVFVTAYDAYAVRGFECNALDYLLKPVHPERLAEAIARVGQRVPPPRAAEREEMVFLKIDTVCRFVPWGEIHHVCSEGNYTRVCFEDGSTALVLKPLKEWLAQMPERFFQRIHRTALVRLDAICEVRPAGRDRRELLLTGGTVLPVGGTFWKGLKERLSAG